MISGSSCPYLAESPVKGHLLQSLVWMAVALSPRQQQQKEHQKNQPPAPLLPQATWDHIRSHIYESRHCTARLIGRLSEISALRVDVVAQLMAATVVLLLFVPELAPLVAGLVLIGYPLATTYLYPEERASRDSLLIYWLVSPALPRLFPHIQGQLCPSHLLRPLFGGHPRLLHAQNRPSLAPLPRALALCRQFGAVGRRLPSQQVDVSKIRTGDPEQTEQAIPAPRDARGGAGSLGSQQLDEDRNGQAEEHRSQGGRSDRESVDQPGDHGQISQFL